jgi:hypothetical protein
MLNRLFPSTFLEVSECGETCIRVHRFDHVSTACSEFKCRMSDNGENIKRDIANSEMTFFVMPKNAVIYCRSDLYATYSVVEIQRLSKCCYFIISPEPMKFWSMSTPCCFTRWYTIISWPTHYLKQHYKTCIYFAELPPILQLQKMPALKRADKVNRINFKCPGFTADFASAERGTGCGRYSFIDMKWRTADGATGSWNRYFRRLFRLSFSRDGHVCNSWQKTPNPGTVDV